MKRKILVLIVMSIVCGLSFPTFAYVRDISSEEWRETPKVVPQVIVFYADWCQPSQAYLPTVRDLERDYTRRVDFFMINIDDNPDMVADFGVPVIPCTYFIYESNLDTGDYKWMGEKLGQSRYKLMANIIWLLDNWKLSGELSEKDQLYLEDRSKYFSH